MKYYKIKEHPNLYRDSETNVIVNNNMKEYNDYVARKKAKNIKINELEMDVKTLKEDIGEIKNLLRSLIDESKKI